MGNASATFRSQWLYHPAPMRRALPVIILLLGLLAILVDFFPLRVPALGAGEGGDRVLETKLGLDLRGGLRVEYQVLPAEGQAPGPEDLEVIRNIVVNRVDRAGVAEPVVTVQGSDRIVVEMPGVQDPDAIRNLVGQTGRLDFVPLGQTQVVEGQVLDLTRFPPLFSGDQVASASIGADQTGARTVDFVLEGDGARLFSEYTRQNVGSYFAIVLDGEVISAPVIRQEIPTGQVQISQGGIGGYPLREAQNLVTVLEFGQLEYPLQELANTSVSPTLGEAFLRQSLLGGGIAVILVMVFMVVHYRLPGVIAAAALIYYTLLVLALFRLIPVTLTLAGIAGFVLSVGMAVDANILIFERTKEELRVGKSLPAAIEAGFNRAWNSILDSNVSSLITAMILFIFGSSVIRGFGLVLIIGVLVSMFTAITVTRTVLRLIVERDMARKAWLFGVSDEEFLARPAGRSPRRAARSRGEAGSGV
jgi:protein-export membrane protein SecD